MSKLIVSELMTLDGVIEAPYDETTHPHGGWGNMWDEDAQLKVDEILEAESLLLGRVTYEEFADTWTQREGTLAEKMNAMPKYVVSSTLREPLAWNNSRVLRGDIAAAVRELEAAPGGPLLVVGSCTLVPFLLDHGLVDELRLMVFPIIVGGGKRAFSDSRVRTSLALSSSRRLPSHITVQTYVIP